MGEYYTYPRNAISICIARYGWYVLGSQVIGTWTGRYRQNRSSTVDFCCWQLIEGEKGKKKKRKKRKKKKRRRREKYLLARALSLPVGPLHAVAARGSPVHHCRPRPRAIFLPARGERSRRQLLVELLENKEALWNEKKHGASECIEELSGHCSGSWVNTSMSKVGDFELYRPVWASILLNVLSKPACYFLPRFAISIFTARYGRYISVCQVAGTRIDRRRSFEREKGKKKKRKKKKKKRKEEKKNTSRPRVVLARVSLSPAGRGRFFSRTRRKIEATYACWTTEELEVQAG
ncbi:hypothetical protein GW17_00004152 [Ensete ventricosum]|nr:hypothetical protein GW17_00004152 [Ensete ventricosum]